MGESQTFGISSDEARVILRWLGFHTEAHGTAVGTGAEQEVIHGLAVTPTYDQVFLSEAKTGGALAYQSNNPSSVHLHITATNLKDFNWRVIYTPLV